MTNPIIRIHNTETDEVVDREMNVDELTQYEADQTQAEAIAVMQAKANAAKAAAQAKLAALGLTTDDLKALGL